MRCKTLIALFVSMLIGLPAIGADWPAGEREKFMQDCQSSGQATVAPDKLQRYCGCAADKISNEFSREELDRLKGQKTPLPEETQARLVKVSQSCLSQLNG
ncbi:hypothetical protein [Pseudomonas sp. LFM046]|uniref:hypothetical protein n=1 Tax=Pseudomonas sp. LFM046 TaxID=1608357 RepID=UPI0005CF9EC9|nr:hypothetical protein [Pseudomonas sp. LFM046]